MVVVINWAQYLGPPAIAIGRTRPPAASGEGMVFGTRSLQLLLVSFHPSTLCASLVRPLVVPPFRGAS